MPLYETRCKVCKSRGADIFRTVAQRDENLSPCPFCGGETERIISRPFVQTDIPSFISPATGKPIHSRRELREDLARSGHFLWESGVEKDIARNRQARIEESFAPIEKTVDEVVTNLAVAGKLES